MVRWTTIISGGPATTTAGGPTLMLTFTSEKAVPAAKTANSSANVTQTIRPAIFRLLIPTPSGEPSPRSSLQRSPARQNPSFHGRAFRFPEGRGGCAEGPLMEMAAILYNQPIMKTTESPSPATGKRRRFSPGIRMKLVAFLLPLVFLLVILIAETVTRITEGAIYEDLLQRGVAISRVVALSSGDSIF